jgi:hypothetical protein
LIQAALAVVIAKLAIRTLPLPAARTIVSRQQCLRRIVAPVRAARIVWAVETTSRVVPRMKNCLVQAVAAEAMLIQAGYPCELRIGAAKNGADELIAHAWVESEGTVAIGEFDLDQYTQLMAPRLQSGKSPVQLQAARDGCQVGGCKPPGSCVHDNLSRLSQGPARSPSAPAIGRGSEGVRHADSRLSFGCFST